MLEGDLLSLMQNTHALQQRHNFSLTELYAMTPWELDVRSQLVMVDQERKREEMARGNSHWR
jgi:hypothetical protein